MLVSNWHALDGPSGGREKDGGGCHVTSRGIEEVVHKELNTCVRDCVPRIIAGLV